MALVALCCASFDYDKFVSIELCSFANFDFEHILNSGAGGGGHMSEDITSAITSTTKWVKTMTTPTRF